MRRLRMIGDHPSLVGAEAECTSPHFCLSSLSVHGSVSFSVQGSPNDQLAFSNCLVVNPQDFPEGQHVLVKQAFPLTTR